MIIGRTLAYKTVYEYNYTNVDAIAVGNAAYGEGDGPIFLNSLDCNGTEENILLCPLISSFFFASILCQDHSNDAGVICDGESKYVTIKCLKCSYTKVSKQYNTFIKK